MAGSLAADPSRSHPSAVSRRGLIWKLLVVGLLIRVVLAVILPPGYDEAYYLFYGQNPSPSYFDHPLAVGLWSWLGEAFAGLPSPPLMGTPLLVALRLPSLLAYTAGLALISDATHRWFGRPAALGAVLIGTVSPLLFLCGGLLLLPDSPLLLVLAGLLNWLSRRSQVLPRTASQSLALGGLLGLATLGKYHALIILLSLVAYTLSRPQERSAFSTPWPWLTVPVWLLVSSPLWIWNARNGWISFLFHGGRTGARAAFDPAGPLLFLLSQQLLLFPTIGLLLLMALVRPLPTRQGPRPGAREATLMLRWLAWPQVLLFLLLAGRMQVLASWLVPAWWLLVPAAGSVLADLWHGGRRRLVTMGSLGTVLPLAVLLPLAAAQTRWDLLGRWLPPGVDPSGQLMVPEDLRAALIRDPRIWSQLRQAEVIAATRYDLPGFFALAIGSHSRARYTSFGKDARGFAWWQPDDGFRGRSGVLVLFQQPGEPSALQEPSTALPERIRRDLPDLQPLGVVHVRRAGRPTAQIEVIKFGPLPNRWRRPYGPGRSDGQDSHPGS